ncbi:MAG: bleomycin resistance protein [Comamonas sp.]
MFEQASGPGRRWITGPLEWPYGRGVNLQIECTDVLAMHSRVLMKSAESIYVPLEKKRYACGAESRLVMQFVVQDPDGYLLRFSQNSEII